MDASGLLGNVAHRSPMDFCIKHYDTAHAGHALNLFFRCSGDPSG